MRKNINPENPSLRGGERQGLGRADLGQDNTRTNKKYRPRVHVPYTKASLFFEAAATLAFLLFLAVFIYVMIKSPDLVPIHYGQDGNPDVWGPKTNLWGTFLVGFVAYGALFAVSRFPHALNYFVGITEENAVRQYGLMRNFLTVIRAIAAGLFAYILYSTYMMATNIPVNREPNMLIIFGFLVVTVFLYLLLAARNK